MNQNQRNQNRSNLEEEKKAASRLNRSNDSPGPEEGK